MLLIDEFQSPLGRIAIAARDGRLCALEFGRARLARQLAARYPDLPRRHMRNPFGVSVKLRAYLAGDLAAVERIRVETGGTPFQQRVWRALRRIPAGQPAVAHGAAARAVGAANGRNPISLVVPCHRLIGGDAALTGYGGGLWRKRWLLCHEGAQLRATRTRSAGGRSTGRSR